MNTPQNVQIMLIRIKLSYTVEVRSFFSSTGIGNGDEIFIVGESDNAIQVLYPLIAGGYKISWIPIDKLSELFVEHMPGDINGDGVVNTKDLTRLMKYLSGEEVDVVSEAADVNGDGAVNGKDLTRLMKYISGKEAENF